MGSIPTSGICIIPVFPRLCQMKELVKERISCISRSRGVKAADFLWRNKVWQRSNHSRVGQA